MDQFSYQTEEIVEAFKMSRSRLMLLDYDGTLAPYSQLPREAVPAPKLIDLLRSLAQDKSAIINIVSGRAKADLEQWFGDID